MEEKYHKMQISTRKIDMTKGLPTLFNQKENGELGITIVSLMLTKAICNSDIKPPNSYFPYFNSP